MITGVAIVAASSGGAFAQAAPEAAPVQELVVTGSRIRSPNLTSVSPVATVNSKDIKLQGATNIEDIINNLPQAFADFGGFESNGSSGTATVDLRGLGNTRTLVLIDGKRLQPGDPTQPVADLNFIPPALIERVDVLTGGASAVYGSDAVAGVVNFIMKKNFEGIQIDAETSVAQVNNNNQQVRKANVFGHTNASLGFHFPLLNLPSGSVWDGQRHTATIIGGANSPDGKGNVEFYLGYTSIDAVREGQRDYSTCSLATNNTNTTQQYCGGSSSSVPGRVTPRTGPNQHTYFIDFAPGVLLPRFNHGRDFNYAPYNYFQRPDTRYTAGEYSHYEINKAIDLYSSFMFMDDHTVAAIAPSGSFYGDTNYTIPCADPLLSSTQANTLCGTGVRTGTATAQIGRRNVEGAPRTADLEHQDYRIVFGSKGDLGQGWSYDISAQYGRSVLTDIEGGYFLKSKLTNALNVVTDPRAGSATFGQPVCQSVLDGTDKNCVPYNIWAAGGVTPGAINYLTGSSISSGVTTEQVVTGSVTGDLGQYGFKSPWATTGVGVSIGAEYRREFLQLQYDSVAQSGDLAGAGGFLPNTKGSQSDKDIFGEIRVPLAENMPFVKDLTFEGGYRYSNYTSGGGNNTYKFGLDWQVVPDLRLRASYERAVRAPNVFELFQPLHSGLTAGSDPCAGGTPAYTAAQCYNTILSSFPAMTFAQFTTPGAPTNPFNPTLGHAPIYGSITQCISAQCGNLNGGNPGLVPEIADTKSLGVVFTPTFFKGFSLSVDYFDIKVDKAILNLPTQTLLNNCGILGNAFDCSLITRDSQNNYAVFGGLAAGALNQQNNAGFIYAKLVNASSIKTRGVDVDATYRTSFDAFGLPNWGGLSFHFSGTYLDKLQTTLPDGTAYDCAGLYGVTCGTPSPKWRHQLRVSWNAPWENLVLSANWRYLAATSLDFNTSTPDLQNGFTDTLKTDAHIPSYSYFDVAFSFKVKDRYNVELLGETFNLFNHLNQTGVASTSAYSVANGAAGVPNTLVSNTAFAAFDTTKFLGNANSNFIYTPRQVQLGARVQF